MTSRLGEARMAVSLLASILAGGVGGVLATTAIHLAPALAASCTISNDNHVSAGTNDGLFRRGLGVGNIAPYTGLHTGGTQTTTCDRVGTLILTYNSSFEQMEIGWITDTTQSISCVPSSSSNPWLFRQYIIDTVPHCSVYLSPRPAPGTWHQYWIERDTSDVNKWHFFYDGTEIGGAVTDPNMTLGYPTAQTERHDSYDSAYGNFGGVTYKSSTGWHLWSADQVCWDSDDGFDNQLSYGGDPAHIEMNPVTPDQNFPPQCPGI